MASNSPGRSKTQSKHLPQEKQEGQFFRAVEVHICPRIQLRFKYWKNRYNSQKYILNELLCLSNTEKELANSRGLSRWTEPLRVSKVSDCSRERNRGNFSGQSKSSPFLLVGEATASSWKQWKEITVGLSGPVQTSDSQFYQYFLDNSYRRWVLAWAHSWLFAGLWHFLKPGGSFFLSAV